MTAQSLKLRDAQSFHAHKVCKICFGNLRMDFDPDDRDCYLVGCSNEAHNGFISRARAERVQGQDSADAREVRRTYGKLLDLEVGEKKSANDNIKDLGF